MSTFGRNMESIVVTGPMSRHRHSCRDMTRPLELLKMYLRPCRDIMLGHDHTVEDTKKNI